jgi:hypothetical protein
MAFARVCIVLIGCLFAGCKEDTGAQRREAAPTTQHQLPADSAQETCSFHFTPYTKEAGHCSADHTVCRKGPDGDPLCHGGAIVIRCGETGERCGKTLRCECATDQSAAAPPGSAERD